MTATADASFPGRNGKIAYTSSAHMGRGDYGTRAIYTMSASLHDPSRLIAGSVEVESPAWSADGRRIAFTRNDGAPTYQNVYVANADGSGITQVTSGTDSETDPSWSPDGSHLLYVTSHADLAPDGSRYLPSVYSLHRVNPDGSGDTALISGSSNALANPKYSPDGSKISYTRYGFSLDRDGFRVDGDGAIWVMHADGSGQEELVDPDVSVENADWSPNGRKVAYARKNRGSGYDIYLSAATQGSRAQAVVSRSRTQADPVFSPDGLKLAYSDYDGGSDRTGDYNVCTVTVPSTARRSRPATPRCTTSSNWEFSPNWQPLR